ncbi:hypothetical protein BU17DRAFT_94775 [Hysterangium stoloniferum]|nr:hypothetical protein BU17DRAFT_94775 [Hysterangium stoloniferum]
MFSVWALAIVALAFPYRSSATATTTVACITDEWTYNQDHLSPCLVASALQAACDGGSFGFFQPGMSVHWVQIGIISVPPQTDQTNGNNIITWSQWSFNCTASDITISQFPITIPPAIAIPSWAYLNVTTPNVWDYAAALAVHNSGAPDSTAAPSATGAPASAGTVRKKSNHAGAIAGGVVGGVVGLSLIAIGVFLLMKRRNTTTPVSNGGREKFDVAASPTSSRGFPSPTFPMQADWQRYYDRSNPRTFPDSSLPVYVPATATPDSVVTYYHPQGPQSLPPDSPPGGQYTGTRQFQAPYQ